MTDQEKIAFLSAEGWICGEIEDGVIMCADPKYAWKEKTELETIDDAYRIASHRKGSRDRVRLKRAGWWTTYRKWYNDFSPLEFTKSEALKTLDSKEDAK